LAVIFFAQIYGSSTQNINFCPLDIEGGLKMNGFQKDQIMKLRANGESYSSIASKVDISINTIKAFCRRSNNGEEQNNSSSNVELCRQCYNPLTNIENKKKKTFCSNKCRMSWWNNSQNSKNRKSNRQFTCQACEQTFIGTGKRMRKFCSRVCYFKPKAVLVE